jgi:hypothetical protein
VFFFIVLPAMLVLGMLLIAGPALLPFAVVALVGLVIYRAVGHHRHPDQTLHPH